MEIKIEEPDGPYSATIDTGVMRTTIREAFLGVMFETDGGEKLAVSMRDNGFEVIYSGDFGQTGFNVGVTEFKDGQIKRGGRNVV